MKKHYVYVAIALAIIAGVVWRYDIQPRQIRKDCVVWLSEQPRANLDSYEVCLHSRGLAE